MDVSHQDFQGLLESLPGEAKKRNEGRILTIQPQFDCEVQFQGAEKIYNYFTACMNQGRAGSSYFAFPPPLLLPTPSHRPECAALTGS